MSFSVVVLESNLVLFSRINIVWIVRGRCSFAMLFLSLSQSCLALAYLYLKWEISWLLVRIMSPKWMATLFSWRAVARRWTIRHRNTLSCSLFNLMIIFNRALLSSKLSSNLGVVKTVLLAVHLDAGTRLVISVTVSILFMLIRWAWVGHRYVASTRQSISHRGSISLICVSIVHLLTIVRSMPFSVNNFLLYMMSWVFLRTVSVIFRFLLGYVIQLNFLLNLS